jgi:VanZ family protein
MMPEKGPETYAFITYVWVFILAMFGGAVSYLRKLKNGRKWKITDFLIEILTAAFTGITMFFLCQSLGLSQVFTAALVGISGHFSSRAITLFGAIMDKVLKKLT